MTAEVIPHSSRHSFLQLPRALRSSLVFGKLSVLSSSATRDMTPSKGSYQRAKLLQFYCQMVESPRSRPNGSVPPKEGQWTP